MKKLVQYAQMHGSDKALSARGYAEVYEKLLEHRRIDGLLEIGRGSWASVRTWLDYLPRSEIYCMEQVDPLDASQIGQSCGHVPGVVVITGKSTTIGTWERTPEDLDVIIDNGPPIPQDQIARFNLGFSKLRAGGLWIIEDTHSSFEKANGYQSGVGHIFQWLFTSLLMKQGLSVVTGEHNDGSNYKHIKQVRSFQVFKSLFVIEKL